MKKILAFGALSLVLVASAAAETSMWRVQRGASVLYLGGTCHVLRPSDYPLPKEFDKAFRRAHTVVFETDLERMKSPEVQQALLREGTYPEGTGLRQVLSPKAYQELARYCAENGLSMVAFDRFRPPLVVLTLLGLEFQKLGIVQGGVDEFFHARARAAKKPVHSLESAEQQLAFVLGMGQGRESEFLLLALADLKRTKAVMEELIGAWRAGDERTLSILIVDQMKDFPELYHSLFVARNRAWLPVLEGYLRSPEPELVLVGAGHLVGPDGLVAQLKKRGYRVTKAAD
ncbi:MAG: TraB/GumN family protein [Deltaproteobacteria bacterium]|nr:TraB/GumN family protein [Deltaproteobacteria bacterium]